MKISPKQVEYKSIDYKSIDYKSLYEQELNNSTNLNKMVRKLYGELSDAKKQLKAKQLKAKPVKPQLDKCIDIDRVYASHWLLDNELINKYVKNDEDTPFTGSHYLFRIKDTIHYKSLEGSDYSDYDKYITSSEQFDHTTKKFIRLQQKFDVSKMKPIVVEYDEYYDKYIIQDGVHRLSILLHNRIISTTIPLVLLKIL